MSSTHNANSAFWTQDYPHHQQSTGSHHSSHSYGAPSLNDGQFAYPDLTFNAQPTSGYNYAGSYPEAPASHPGHELPNTYTQQSDLAAKQTDRKSARSKMVSSSPESDSSSSPPEQHRSRSLAASSGNCAAPYPSGPDREKNQRRAKKHRNTEAQLLDGIRSRIWPEEDRSIVRSDHTKLQCLEEMIVRLDGTLKMQEAHANEIASMKATIAELQQTLDQERYQTANREFQYQQKIDVLQRMVKHCQGIIIARERMMA
ncbi:hypothetical protein EWM64_g7890 [Hericium alpestre]|uniref:Uncharacterized protein n=1 Tax=Hericium alpestre TaxID=135208 RepID=A0A4Y9ZRK6_9AGAM|nr:hypothetical protein EWM64_g7890 [Hericium alpestre]